MWLNADLDTLDSLQGKLFGGAFQSRLDMQNALLFTNFLAV